MTLDEAFKFGSMPGAPAVFGGDIEAKGRVAHLVIEKWFEPHVATLYIKLLCYANFFLLDEAGSEYSFLSSRAPLHAVIFKFSVSGEILLSKFGPERLEAGIGGGVYL